MNLASAYPNSAISPLAMTVIAVVAVATVALWIIMVFRADRTTGVRQAERHVDRTVSAASPDNAVGTAEDAATEAEAGQHTPHSTMAA